MVQIFSKYLFSQITLGQEVVLLCWKWIKMAAANPKTGTGLSVRPEDEIGSIADRCLQVPILCVLSFFFLSKRRSTTLSIRCVSYYVFVPGRC